MARVAELDEHSDRRRKRSSISPPIQTDPKWDEGAVYQSLLRTAGIHPVSDHISSIGAPLKAPPELLIIDRALSPLLPKVRGGMISRLLNTINELAIAEDRIRQASIKSQKLWRALDPSVSPISQLPDELLLMIFDHGAQDELTQLLTYNSESSDFPVVGDATLETNIRPHFPFPLLVSHICENWRSLALDRSSLWTHINPYWNIHQVTMWLQRSKNKPLHLDLIDAVSRVGEIQYSLIREHASRWSSAVVHIGNVVMEGGEDGVANCLSDFLFTTNGDKPTRLPRLRHLSISSSASVRLPLYASGLDLFPSLETLRLSNAAVGSIDELFSRVIRAQADLSGLFTWNWSGIGSATRLKSLTLHSPPGAQDEENGLEDGWTTWSLPTLTHLCIDSMPSGVCRSFLTMLRAPALQSFHMFLKGKDRRARQAMLDFVSNVSFAPHRYRSSPRRTLHCGIGTHSPIHYICTIIWIPQLCAGNPLPPSL
ncbi:hypothetical protein DL93DRAFT_1051321 [Clavulina sp. PMI_390]|nr:hypothetical protein DL93DRAFT_1051321 [Clavulina sp. PMI_390]